jgi:hypothetical protein
MKKRVTKKKEESTICPMTDEVRKILIETLDAKIRELVEARESLMLTGTVGSIESPGTSTATSTLYTASLAPPTKKGHVSEAAKTRLSQRMKLVWAVRNATQRRNRAEIKAAKEALEQWDRENPKK